MHVRPKSSNKKARVAASQAMSSRYCGNNLKILREHVADAQFDPIDLG